MVAYSFRKQFVTPIRLGLGDPKALELFPTPEMGFKPKRQTIRPDRKRHARPGEELQLYAGMRTKHCFLIGKARCVAVEPIRIRLEHPQWIDLNERKAESREELDKFARLDGFADWPEMAIFWFKEHPGISIFTGIIIRWEPL